MLMTHADPQPPTVADLAEHGPVECLAALRDLFEAHHADYPQYRGWTEDTVLGVVEQRIGGGPRPSEFLRAEVGDLVLVKRDTYPWFLGGLHRDDVAYVPRVGWNVGLGPFTEVRDVAV